MDKKVEKKVRGDQWVMGRGGGDRDEGKRQRGGGWGRNMDRICNNLIFQDGERRADDRTDDAGGRRGDGTGK